MAWHPDEAMRYVTSTAYARNRVGRAAKIFYAGLAGISIFEQAAALDRWLPELHPGSLGWSISSMTRALCADQSVGEVHVALAAIGRGEGELTTTMYSRVRARWRRIQALQTAN